jgi:hypothetical protein
MKPLDSVAESKPEKSANEGSLALPLKPSPTSPFRDFVLVAFLTRLAPLWTW